MTTHPDDVAEQNAKFSKMDREHWARVAKSMQTAQLYSEYLRWAYVTTKDTRFIALENELKKRNALAVDNTKA